jgi:UDP-N-acetylmuramate-alanine ligase
MKPEEVGEQVVAAIRIPGARFIQGLEQAADFLLEELRPGDVVLVLSAGDATRISQRISQALSGAEGRQPARSGGDAGERRS